VRGWFIGLLVLALLTYHPIGRVFFSVAALVAIGGVVGWAMRRKEVDCAKDATAKRYKDAEMETGPQDGLNQELMALGMRWNGEDPV